MGGKNFHQIQTANCWQVTAPGFLDRRKTLLRQSWPQIYIAIFFQYIAPMESELCNIYFNWILSIRSTPGEVKALLDNSFSLIKVRKSDFICVYEHVCSLLIRHFDYCNSKIIRRESIYFFHTVELYQIVIYF